MKTTIHNYNEYAEFSNVIKTLLTILLFLTLLYQPESDAQSSIPYRWKNVAIGGGGYVSGIITSPAQKNLIYLRTDVGGSYRWNPVDSSWIPLNYNLAFTEWGYQGIESIAIDPSDSNKVYEAAGEYVLWSPTTMLRSNDRGKTWKKANVSFLCGGNDYGRSVDERLVVDPNKGSTLLMGTRTSGLWKSIDSAATWKKVSSFPVTTTSGSTGITFVKFIKDSGSFGNETPLIFIGVARTHNTNLYYSSDTGKTWQAVPGQSTNFMPVHAAVAADSLIYIAYSDTAGPYLATNGRVLKYNLKLKTFTDISPIKSGCAFSGVSVYPSNPDLVFVSTMDHYTPMDEIYRSIDGGTTWKATLGGQNRHDNGFKYVQPPLNPHWTTDVEVDPFNPDHVLFVTGYGIWSTYNASNVDAALKVDWYFTAKGLEETVVKEIVSPTFGAPELCVIGDYDGFRNDSLDVPSKYGNFTPSIGSTTSMAIAENMPSFMARVGNTGQYSSNGGINWSTLRTPSGVTNGYVAVSADGSTIIWTSQTGIAAYTNNRGISWQTCSGLPSSFPSNNDLRIIADFVNPNKFYGYDKSTGDIYVSTNGGQSFDVTTTTMPNGGILRATLGKEGDLFLPLGNNGLWHSVNSGTSFSQITAIQSILAVGTGKAIPGNNYPAVYIIGTIGGVAGIYRSDDTCKTWSRINDSNHSFGGIDLIAGDSREPGRVYVASDYNGIGIVYGIPVFDCHSDSAGTAFIDDCGTCVSGNTGLQACRLDCNGDQNGTATIDICGYCVGGNTGKDSCTIDCAGIVNGAAYKDTCGKCVGGTTGKIDCALSAIKENKLGSLVLFPNPFTNNMQIKSTTPTEYSIFNILGKQEEAGVCSNTCTVGESLKSGVYLIKLKNNQETKFVKIIKL